MVAHTKLVLIDVAARAHGQTTLPLLCLVKESRSLAAIGRSPMATFEQANKLVNEASRVVDALAQEIASLEFGRREGTLRQLAEALESLSKVKDEIIGNRPDLEYHMDSNRSSTLFMEKIDSFVRQADELMAHKRFSEAIVLLERALEMGPPPLIHEALTKKINRATEIQASDNC